MAIEAGGGPFPPRPASTTVSIKGAGSELSLRAGVVVSARVLGTAGETGEGLWRISIGGKELIARADRALAPGAVLRATVEHGAEGLVLRPLVEAAEHQAAVLASLGLPGDAASRAALLAALGAGLKPEAGPLARIRRASLSQGDEASESRAGLAARLEAKGLAALPEAVDELEALADGGGSARDRGNGSGSSPGDGRGKGDGPGSEAPGRRREAGGVSPEAEEVSHLAASLAALSGRLAKDGEGGVLALFNHTGRRGGVLVPFSFTLGNIAFDGSLLLQLPLFPGGPLSAEGRFSAAALDVSGSPGMWYFSFETLGKGRSRLRLEAPADRPGLDWGSLAGSLRASGCELVVGLRAADDMAAEGVLVDA